jgi:hypothetical protein
MWGGSFVFKKTPVETEVGLPKAKTKSFAKPKINKLTENKNPCRNKGLI